MLEGVVEGVLAGMLERVLEGGDKGVSGKVEGV